jgi:hypothetical protein
MRAIILLLAAQTYLWPWQHHPQHLHRHVPDHSPASMVPDCEEINAWVKSHSPERYERAFRSASKEQQKIITDCEVKP